MGHCMRALAFAKKCIEKNHAVDILISDADKYPFSAVQALYSDVISHPLVSLIATITKQYTLIVLDTKEIPVEQVQQYRLSGVCIGIDIGGAGRAYMPYLIDTLPALFSHAPNRYMPYGCIDTSMPKRTQMPTSCKKILLYVPHVLYDAYAAMIHACINNGVRCTVIHGENEIPQNASHSTQNGTIEYISIVSNLSHTMHQYDCVITHFGLGAFEALYARVPVVLVHPSEYHMQLSTYAQFPYSYASYNSALIMLKKWMQDASFFQTCGNAFMRSPVFQRQYSTDTVYSTIFSLTDAIIATYGTAIPANPFVLGKHTPGIAPALWRDKDKSIFPCPHTRLVYQISFTKPVPYEDTYFFEEYKQQYGKTYLEDFSAISSTMERRIETISRVMKKRTTHTPQRPTIPRILDIGCAYGAMLHTAQKRDWISFGVDISDHACAYVQDTFGIPTMCADIAEDNFISLHEKFVRNVLSHENTLSTPFLYDVISCWYVLEHTHFFDIAIKRIYALLASGGVFALAVPNGSGISARKNPNAFFSANPIDHASIFSPRALVRVLSQYGFSLRFMRITGHHPERFFSDSTPNREGKGWYTLLMGISRFLQLGDTFELYLEKA